MNAKKEERLCKIVYNSKGWTNPCERVWNPQKWDIKYSPYEQRTGFVHEDWLFNTQFLIDGYQYGYIKGFEDLDKTISFVDVVHLFTIRPYTKERFYIGKLFNVERLFDGNYPKNVKDAQKYYLPEMKSQLKLVGADFKRIVKSKLVFNVRIKKENINLFQDFIPIVSSCFNKQYTRTLPNKLTQELKKLLYNAELSTSFKFDSSSPVGKKTTYKRTNSGGKTNVSKLHQEIEEELYKYLLKNGVSKNSLACDTTSFGGKFADVVVQHSQDTYSIYEIKTNIDLRSGLRESVGQLLDYANWEKGIKIKELVSVVPDTQTGKQINDYISRIKSSLKYKLRILLYDKSLHTFKEV